MNPETTSWLHRLRGRFIVFDGPDGSGKTTQFQRFAEFAHNGGLEVCEVREPGGTTIGEQIRLILLHRDNEGMDLRCEMLLYMASRAQLVAEKVRRALRGGQLVLADRFISSTLAYQGAAGGIPIDDILSVGRIVLCGTWPDLVIIFDVDEKTAAERLVARPDKKHAHFQIGQPSLFSDRMEVQGLEYWRRVRQGFLDQAKRDAEHHLIIDANAEEDVVYERLIAGLQDKAGSLQ